MTFHFRNCAWRALLATAGLVVLTACSSFGRHWKQASAIPADPHGLAGRWDGEWRSAGNGHHGRLRAVVTPSGDHRYQVRYRASFLGIFHFGYRMDLGVTPAGEGGCEFGGQASLGWWGIYQCTGRADGTNFVARYATKNDYGIFEFHRPPL
jgi:hypothetical protein